MPRLSNVEAQSSLNEKTNYGIKNARHSSRKERSMKSREKRKQKLERLSRVEAGHKKDMPKVEPVGTKRERGVVTVSQKAKVKVQKIIKILLRNRFSDHMESERMRLKKANRISQSILGVRKNTSKKEVAERVEL